MNRKVNLNISKLNSYVPTSPNEEKIFDLGGGMIAKIKRHEYLNYWGNPRYEVTVYDQDGEILVYGSRNITSPEIFIRNKLGLLTTRKNLSSDVKKRIKDVLN